MKNDELWSLVDLLSMGHEDYLFEHAAMSFNKSNHLASYILSHLDEVDEEKFFAKLLQLVTRCNDSPRVTAMSIHLLFSLISRGSLKALELYHETLPSIVANFYQLMDARTAKRKRLANALWSNLSALSKSINVSLVMNEDILKRLKTTNSPLVPYLCLFVKESTLIESIYSYLCEDFIFALTKQVSTFILQLCLHELNHNAFWSALIPAFSKTVLKSSQHALDRLHVVLIAVKVHEKCIFGEKDWNTLRNSIFNFLKSAHANYRSKASDIIRKIIESTQNINVVREVVQLIQTNTSIDVKLAAVKSLCIHDYSKASQSFCKDIADQLLCLFNETKYPDIAFIILSSLFSIIFFHSSLYDEVLFRIKKFVEAGNEFAIIFIAATESKLDNLNKPKVGSSIPIWQQLAHAVLEKNIKGDLSKQLLKTENIKALTDWGMFKFPSTDLLFPFLLANFIRLDEANNVTNRLCVHFLSLMNRIQSCAAAEALGRRISTSNNIPIFLSVIEASDTKLSKPVLFLINGVISTNPKLFADPILEILFCKIKKRTWKKIFLKYYSLEELSSWLSKRTSIVKKHASHETVQLLSFLFSNLESIDVILEMTGDIILETSEEQLILILKKFFMNHSTRLYSSPEFYYRLCCRLCKTNHIYLLNVNKLSRPEEYIASIILLTTTKANSVHVDFFLQMLEQLRKAQLLFHGLSSTQNISLPLKVLLTLIKGFTASSIIPDAGVLGMIEDLFADKQCPLVFPSSFVSEFEQLALENLGRNYKGTLLVLPIISGLFARGVQFSSYTLLLIYCLSFEEGSDEEVDGSDEILKIASLIASISRLIVTNLKIERDVSFSYALWELWKKENTDLLPNFRNKTVARALAYAQISNLEKENKSPTIIEFVEQEYKVLLKEYYESPPHLRHRQETALERDIQPRLSLCSLLSAFFEISSERRIFESTKFERFYQFITQWPLVLDPTSKVREQFSQTASWVIGIFGSTNDNDIRNTIESLMVSTLVNPPVSHLPEQNILIEEMRASVCSWFRCLPVLSPIAMSAVEDVLQNGESPRSLIIEAARVVLRFGLSFLPTTNLSLSPLSSFSTAALLVGQIGKGYLPLIPPIQSSNNIALFLDAVLAIIGPQHAIADGPWSFLFITLLPLLFETTLSPAAEEIIISWASAISSHKDRAGIILQSRFIDFLISIISDKQKEENWRAKVLSVRILTLLQNTWTFRSRLHLVTTKVIGRTILGSTHHLLSSIAIEYLKALVPSEPYSRELVVALREMSITTLMPTISSLQSAVFSRPLSRPMIGIMAPVLRAALNMLQGEGRRQAILCTGMLPSLVSAWKDLEIVVGLLPEFTGNDLISPLFTIITNDAIAANRLAASRALATFVIAMERKEMVKVDCKCCPPGAHSIDTLHLECQLMEHCLTAQTSTLAKGAAMALAWILVSRNISLLESRLQNCWLPILKDNRHDGVLVILDAVISTFGLYVLPYLPVIIEELFQFCKNENTHTDKRSYISILILNIIETFSLYNWIILSDEEYPRVITDSTLTSSIDTPGATLVPRLFLSTLVDELICTPPTAMQLLALEALNRFVDIRGTDARVAFSAIQDQHPKLLACLFVLRFWSSSVVRQWALALWRVLVDHSPRTILAILTDIIQYLIESESVIFTREPGCVGELASKDLFSKLDEMRQHKALEAIISNKHGLTRGKVALAGIAFATNPGLITDEYLCALIQMSVDASPTHDIDALEIFFTSLQSIIPPLLLCRRILHLPAISFVHGTAALQALGKISSNHDYQHALVKIWLEWATKAQMLPSELVKAASQLISIFQIYEPFINEEIIQEHADTTLIDALLALPTANINIDDCGCRASMQSVLVRKFLSSASPSKSHVLALILQKGNGNPLDPSLLLDTLVLALNTDDHQLMSRCVSQLITSLSNGCPCSSTCDACIGITAHLATEKMLTLKELRLHQQTGVALIPLFITMLVGTSAQGRMLGAHGLIWLLRAVGGIRILAASAENTKTDLTIETASTDAATTNVQPSLSSTLVLGIAGPLIRVLGERLSPPLLTVVLQLMVHEILTVTEALAALRVVAPQLLRSLVKFYKLHSHHAHDVNSDRVIEELLIEGIRLVSPMVPVFQRRQLLTDDTGMEGQLEELVRLLKDH